ncbi:hypothetical protein AAFF_G00092360 [Aldrovandia affinis]|uniref:Ig-like domain-containing protein n=1 Tax=Aldrovandia affinis TaxID=143900 RepID=A0AAD7T2K4_9TELE|nr:hypothetical protein AAFF_G00092360 [Aldrovandia affinis]
MGMAGAKGLILIGYMVSGALCNGFTTSMPQHIKALSGSCVLIPCTFNIPDEKTDEMKKPVHGVWIKHLSQFNHVDSTVVFNSSMTHNNGKLEGEIIGELLEKNCTTVLNNFPEDYTDKYYFRIETLFLATFATTPVNIIVTASPQKPRITESSELIEDTTVDLTCSAAAPCPKLLPVLTWTPSLGETQNRLLEDSDKIKSVSSTLTFTPSHLHHGTKISCSAKYSLHKERGYKEAETTITLNVLFSPKDTKASISSSGPVLNGSPVTLTCSSRANPPVSRFTWFRVTHNHTTQEGSGQTLTFNLSSGDVSRYYCEAENQRGKQTSPQVQVSVEGLEKPSGLQAIGGVIGALGVLLPCALLLLFWRLRKSGESSCTSIRMQGTQGQSNASLNSNKATKTTETTEVLDSPQGELQYAEIELFKLRANENSRRGKEERLAQDTEYAECLGELISGSLSHIHSMGMAGAKGLILIGYMVSVLNNFPEDYTDKYYFRIETLFVATFASTPVIITVTASPQKPRITESSELIEDTTVDLTCSAAAPCPKLLPVLTWTPSLGETQDRLLEDSDKIKSVSSTLTFTPSHLHHGTKISCSAKYSLHKERGYKEAETTITLNVLFSPKDTTASISSSGPVLNGSPVTLTCSSRANPPVSRFTWFRVTHNHTTQEGSGQMLTFNSSSGDVGRYYCEAENQRGKQTSPQVQVSVEGLEEPSGLWVIVGVIGALAVLLPCILLLLFC